MEREDGILLAVAEANCRYPSPARYDDEVIVKTWIEKANARMVTFAYEMRLAERSPAGHRLHPPRLRLPRHAAHASAAKYHALFGLGRRA